MISITATERFVTLALGICALIGMIIGAKGKWDQTNSSLAELKRCFDGFMLQHEKDHARIDQRIDRGDERLTDHIGRHRR